MAGYVDGYFDIFLTFYLNHLSPLQGFFMFIRLLNKIYMIGCGGNP